MKKESQKTVKVTPLHDRVLIKETPKEDKKTAGGIIIPDTVKEDRSNKHGIVVAVGKGRYEDGKLIPMSVKPGDKVFYGWGDEIMIDGEEYAIVKESEIIGIIK